MAAAAKVNGKAAAKPTTTADSSAEINQTSGRPDRTAYDDEQNKLKSEIDALQVKLNAVKDKINLTSKDGPHADRRKTLRNEMDEIRNQQANGKNSRGRVLDQLKATQEGITKKTKDLQAAKSKYPYKTLADLDSRVKKLESQIDSGNLKLAEEKRALQEVNQAKRSRKILESFQKDQQSIDEDRAKCDELRKQLDDPESKAASERYDAIKKELDSIKEEGDKVYASRNALYEERNKLKEQIDDLFTKKKAGAQSFREANDRYHLKVAEDRARRNEKRRQQKLAEEAEKAQAVAERLREEADYPAYQREIEECQLLIEHFSLMTKGGVVDTQITATVKPTLVSVPALELRQIDTTPQTGYTALKKKGEDQDNYFVGGKGKKNKGRSSHPSTPSQQPTNTTAAQNQTSPSSGSGSSAPLRLPFHIIEALMKMSIPTPSPDEIPRVLDDCKTKKAWFEANQERRTKENREKAEKEIKRLLAKSGGGGANANANDNDDTNTDGLGDIEPPNGDGEKPAEPAPTPASGPTTEKADGVSPDVVDAKLEAVQE